MKHSYRIGGEIYEVELLGGQVSVDGEGLPAEYLDGESGDWRIEIGGVEHRLLWAKAGRKLWLHFDGRTHELEKVAGGRGGAAGGRVGESQLRAPMPGQVRAVNVKAGEAVEDGQELLSLEAMKMEIRVQAPRAATVAAVHVVVGDSVDKDQLLVELDGED